MSKLILNAAGAKRPRVRQARTSKRRKGSPRRRVVLGGATSGPEKGSEVFKQGEGRNCARIGRAGAGGADDQQGEMSTRTVNHD